MTDASFISSVLIPGPLSRLAELEARYDGPIPERELMRLRFGSALAADIAETKAEIMFFRDMARRARIGGKAWLERGNRTMARAAAADARAYLAGWRNRRHKLAELLQELSMREARADIARQQTLAMVGAAIVAPLVAGGQESGL